MQNIRIQGGSSIEMIPQKKVHILTVNEKDATAHGSPLLYKWFWDGIYQMP